MIKNNRMAEGEGFEPPEGLRPQRFSRPPQSTTLPPLRINYSAYTLFTLRCPRTDKSLGVLGPGHLSDR
jgi:hypothetical protein